MARKRQISLPAGRQGGGQRSVWASLNEPVAYPTQNFANTVFFIAAVMFLVVWIAPYWGTTRQDVAMLMNYESQVLGESIENVIAPEWYYTGEATVSGVVNAFATAGTEIFDISEPVSETVEFYQPGVDAVWNAWLELMADPVSTNY